MNRREWLLRNGGIAAALAPARAALAQQRITRIRFYEPPLNRPQVNQSLNVVTIETAAGLTGIGEGGSRDLLEPCARQLIGQDPSRIEHLWQLMFRGLFYPAGRERLHSLGALDLALWDLRGKALGVPVHQFLGGLTRDYCECYSTSFPGKGSLRETARACIEAGFRAFRTSVAEATPFDSRAMVKKTAENCREIREGVGSDGAWAIDYHTRLDLPDAIRLSTLLEPLEPVFCEDLVRSENPALYRTVRSQVRVPIAVGEQFGTRWDTHELIEQNLIDYTRVTLPNCGGITEYVKLAALCETHSVGLIPHFTGPISEAALVQVCAAHPGPVLLEIVGNGPGSIPYLPQSFDFRKGRVYPNSRPGLGVTLDVSRLKLVSEITEAAQPIPLLHRPDGSFTNW